jgi:intergrase/recombinase
MAFSHYFKQAFPDVPKTLKMLRKTYLIHLTKAVGDDVIKFSSHSKGRVLDRHYLDKKITAKGLEMKMFG